MTCPYLDYRDSDDEHQFETERPYCTVADEFVSPMKADLCNDRFEFDHAEHCEVYKQFTETEQTPSAEAADD